ncbi:MAG: M23 family metallopeptidase [Bacilli bacterium]|nr:M23 family metallopeptidase [Bacilli bacterium]
MKNWVKRIGQNKFQFFFFIGVVAMLVLALVISSALPENESPVDGTIDPTPIDPTPGEVVTPPEETIKLPFDSSMEYSVVRKFYEKDGTKEDQEKSLIKYGTSYRTSVGTSFQNKDNTSFDVLAALSGTVVEIKDSPLYGNYIVLEHNDKLKTYYYSLSEVTISVGTKVAQGDKIGVSGNSEIDKEAGNHVYFKIVRDTNHLNPERVIGKKPSEI